MVTIEITDNNEVYVKESGLIQSKKQIGIDNLLDILLQSRTDTLTTTPILPKGCIYYSKHSNGHQLFVMEVEKRNWNFEYHGTIFKNVGTPKILFLLITTNDMKILNTKMVAVKDNFITADSKLYFWPFSNIGYNFEICWGNAQLPTINQPHELSCIPRLFFSIGNTDCHYGKNNSGLPYRQFLEELQSKEFNEDLLVDANTRFENLISQ